MADQERRRHVELRKAVEEIGWEQKDKDLKLEMRERHISYLIKVAIYFANFKNTNTLINSSVIWNVDSILDWFFKKKMCTSHDFFFSVLFLNLEFVHKRYLTSILHWSTLIICEQITTKIYPLISTSRQLDFHQICNVGYICNPY